MCQVMDRSVCNSGSAKLVPGSQEAVTWYCSASFQYNVISDPCRGNDTGVSITKWTGRAPGMVNVSRVRHHVYGWRCWQEAIWYHGSNSGDTSMIDGVWSEQHGFKSVVWRNGSRLSLTNPARYNALYASKAASFLAIFSVLQLFRLRAFLTDGSIEIGSRTSDVVCPLARTSEKSN
ncbi:hypothetical protein J1614_004699 [Plenodomus biglobosus]|nr:hypothetical protein J1614_004699 [Plenodomus biglobosus]